MEDQTALRLLALEKAFQKGYQLHSCEKIQASGEACWFCLIAHEMGWS